MANSSMCSGYRYTILWSRRAYCCTIHLKMVVGRHHCRPNMYSVLTYHHTISEWDTLFRWGWCTFCEEHKLCPSVCTTQMGVWCRSNGFLVFHAQKLHTIRRRFSDVQSNKNSAGKIRISWCFLSHSKDFSSSLAQLESEEWLIAFKQLATRCYSDGNEITVCSMGNHIADNSGSSSSQSSFITICRCNPMRHHTL